jgi:predicted phosphate transport protein (TIGR00153 family)
VLRRLLPKKTEFFDLFLRQSELAVAGARALQTLLGDLPRAQEHSTRIRQIEHEADAVCQEAMELLHRSFITPIERGDVHALASKLDDVIDLIEATGQRLWLYEIEKGTSEVLEMAGLLVRASEGVQRVVDALAKHRTAPEIRELCNAVKEVEKANDRLLRGATAKLFKEEDAKTLIKWQRIYEDLEEAIDSCEDVANLVEGVALENS